MTRLRAVRASTTQTLDTSFYSALIYVCLTVYKATVTVVDIDSGAEEKIIATSQGSATGLNLKEKQKIYFGGLPTIGNYRFVLCNKGSSNDHKEANLLYLFIFVKVTSV